jgi:hypothetical protein
MWKITMLILPLVAEVHGPCHNDVVMVWFLHPLQAWYYSYVAKALWPKCGHSCQYRWQKCLMYGQKQLFWKRDSRYGYGCYFSHERAIMSNKQ